MTEELSRNIEFELAELICIEHALTPSQAVAGSPDGPGKETCLKVGTALVQALSGPQIFTINFTEDELWQLRERVSIYTSQGANADLGLVIKSKIYQALLSIGNKRAADAVMSDAEVTAAQEGELDEPMSREEVDDAVRRWQEISGYRHNAGPTDRGPGTHHTDDDPPNPARPKTSPKP